jgi:GNAT superfamily N-acetyltransferase
MAAPVTMFGVGGTETLSSEQVTLRDGTVVTLVPMAPADAERLVRFHAGLSPETVYRRFFSFHPELSHNELYRFTHVDHRDREAMVASNGAEVVAVARFDRGSDPAVAEVAFVVADPWQGRGLGSLLFRRLAERARSVGVRRFVADTLPENSRMLAVFHHAGVPVTSSHADGVVHLELLLDAYDPPQDTGRRLTREGAR